MRSSIGTIVPPSLAPLISIIGTVPKVPGRRAMELIEEKQKKNQSMHLFVIDVIGLISSGLFLLKEKFG